MLIGGSDEARKAILGAMAAVAAPMSEADRRSLDGAARFVMAMPETPEIREVTPEELAQVLLDPKDREAAVRFMTVMTLVDGAIDPARIAKAEAFAAALNVDEPGLDAIAATAKGHMGEVLACMMRKNITSVLGHPAADYDFYRFFFPYRGEGEDPALLARFEALGDYPEGTLGREYHDWYKRNGFKFPGDPNGLNILFAVPHDSTHMLSGYDASPHGETLVSAFTAGMHPQEPMEGHILPVIYSFHLGIHINDLANTAVGAFDPVLFWEAWERGSEVKADVFREGWDFWGLAKEPLADLKARYSVPPLARTDQLPYVP